MSTIRTQFCSIDGLSIRFAESEDRDTHALLLSPWPESVFAFEPTWSRLGWGLARFVNGKPADEAVHNTCFSCHETVKARDFVFNRYAP